MNLTPIHNIFDVKYGNSLSLNKLNENSNGINFVSRTSKNNGVSSKVDLINDEPPNPPGTITVSLGGSVLEAFLQPEPFYTGYHIYCLSAKVNMTDMEKLYFCMCISLNKYRYNYGRQANRTLKDLLIPSPSEIPHWVNDFDLKEFDGASDRFYNINTPELDTSNWKWFEIQSLFDIQKGKRLTKANMTNGETPFIGAIDSNNGYRQFIGQNPIHDGNTITVNYNGSIAETFYQPKPFWATDDVNVLYPKFELNQYIGLFFATIIRLEKYRFNYGRKWHMERMKTSLVKLPVDSKGNPDYRFMEDYIKSLPFSKKV